MKTSCDYMCYTSGLKEKKKGQCFTMEENYSDLILALGMKIRTLKGGLFKTHNN